jgi:hypothetical protein
MWPREQLTEEETEYITRYTKEHLRVKQDQDEVREVTIENWYQTLEFRCCSPELWKEQLEKYVNEFNTQSIRIGDMIYCKLSTRWSHDNVHKVFEGVMFELGLQECGPVTIDGVKYFSHKYTPK